MRRLVPITAIAAVVAILGTTAYAQSADSGPEFSSAILDSTGQLTISFDNTIDFTQLDYSKLYIRERGESTGGVPLHLYNVTYNGTTYEYSSTIEKDGGGDGDGDGEFHGPQDVAVNRTGHIFVADTVNNRVQILYPNGTHIRSINATDGSQGNGDGEFHAPQGIAVNGTDHIFVADFYNNRVQILYPNGTHLDDIKRIGGGSGSGDGNFTQPHGVAIDYDENIITNENSNDRVQIFYPNGTFKQKFGSSGCDPGMFSSARHTTALPDGRLFVTGDSCNNVQVFYPPDYSTAESDVGEIGDSGNDLFSNPAGITHDIRGMVLVSDTDYHQIRMLDPDRVSPGSDATPNAGAITDEILGTSTGGSDDDEFDTPYGLAADRHGRLFVADTLNHRIQVFVLASADIRLSLNSTDLAAVHGMTDPVLDIETGAARTAGGTDVKPSIDNTITILDSTGPEFELAKLYNTTGEFSIYLDETVNPFRTDPTELHIRDRGQSEGGVTLSTNPIILDTYSFDSVFPDDSPFDDPSGIAIASDGDVIISDAENHCVLIFHPNGTMQTIIGKNDSCATGNNGLGQGEFDHPRGVAVDSNDRIYVADSTNCRVQVFDDDGDYRSTIGHQRTTGDRDNCNDGYDRFRSPRDVAIDDNDRLIVVEHGNHRVQIFNSGESRSVTQIGKEVASAPARGTGPDEFTNPRGVATNGTHIFVTDTGNHRVLVFDSGGDPVGDPIGRQGNGIVEFKDPHGIAVDDNRIIIVDSGNHRVQILGSDGAFVDEFGSRGDTAGKFQGPYGVTVDDTGRIWVSDTGDSDRIQRFTILDGSTHIIQDFTPHLYQSVGSFGTANGTFNQPYDVAVDHTGRIIVADTSNNRIQIFGPDGDHEKTIKGDGARAFNTPRGVAVNDSGQIFVSDEGDGRVQILNPDGTFTEITINRWGIGSISNLLQNTHGIAIDDSGRILVTETGNGRVQIFNQDGTTVHTLGDGPTSGIFSEPNDVAANAGVMVVADTKNHAIQIFNSTDFSPVGKIGKDGGGGDNNIGTLDDEFNHPRGVAVDHAGRIWVADTGNHRIQVFDPDGVFLAKFGKTEEGNPVSGSGPDALYKPRGIFIDHTGMAWVADTANHRVQAFVFSSDGLLFSLTSRALSMVNDMQTPELDIDQFAIYDTGGNTIDRSHDNKITTDTTAPVINLTSIMPGSGTVGYGGTISIMLSVSESGLSIHPNSTINNMPIKNDTLLYDSNTGNYTITYTVSESDVSVPDGQGIPANIILYDTARNPSNAITILPDDDSPGIDGSRAAVMLNHTGTSLAPDATKLVLQFNQPVRITDVQNLLLTVGGSQMSLSDHNVIVTAGSIEGHAFAREFGSLGTENGNFTQPSDIAINGTGHMYVADSANHRIQIFTPDGTHIRSMGNTTNDGDPVLGDGDEHFKWPRGIAVNSTGHVFVSDTDNHRVQVFDHNLEYIRTIGKTGDSGRANDQFDQPLGIAVNSTDHIFVADYVNHRIMVLDPEGKPLVAYGGGECDEDNTCSPNDVSVNATGHIFVAVGRGETTENRVHIRSPGDVHIHSIGNPAGPYDPGTAAEHFDSPRGVDASLPGRILVADTGNNRVQMFTSNGTHVGYLADNNGTRSGDAGGEFNQPFGVIYHNGTIYVADTHNNRIQIFEPTSTVFTLDLSVIPAAASAAAKNELFISIPVGGITTADRLHFAAPDRFPRLIEDGDGSDDDDVTETPVSVAVAVPEQASSTVHRSGGGGGGGTIISGTPIVQSLGEAASVLHRVYWETSNDMITLYMVTSTDGSEPYVYLRTPDSGTITAKISDSQPYLGRTLYEVEISASNNFAQVYVDDISQYILLDAPKGDVPVTLYDRSDTSLVEPAMDESITEPDPVIEPKTSAEPESPPADTSMMQDDPLQDDPVQDVEPVPVAVDPEPTDNEQIPDDDINGCLIATAAYGTELAPQVQLLRELRDGSLLQTHSGTAFMGAFNNIYYAFSPEIADLQRENPAFREATKLLLTPMLYTLNIMSIADDEISVLGLGLSVIALNVGMYLAAPAFAGYAMYKHRKN